MCEKLNQYYRRHYKKSYIEKMGKDHIQKNRERIDFMGGIDGQCMTRKDTHSAQRTSKGLR